MQVLIVLLLALILAVILLMSGFVTLVLLAVAYLGIHFGLTAMMRRWKSWTESTAGSTES